MGRMMSSIYFKKLMSLVPFVRQTLSNVIFWGGVVVTQNFLHGCELFGCVTVCTQLPGYVSIDAN